MKEFYCFRNYYKLYSCTYYYHPHTLGNKQRVLRKLQQCNKNNYNSNNNDESRNLVVFAVAFGFRYYIIIIIIQNIMKIS